ncbi:Phosphinothricin acetyltransferase [Mycolicibacterium mageritense DSM 44476 = CIP 104973]|uniref:N-acetyltransferase n=1 Tax=Mycolicibacterium mageritense TaxID=53462 RepID=A0AAI8TXE4_MYCME|nr:GNAT family N-acetyltransferase [Mycolicibacterium mageritense]MCC9184668.1 N-acetyltransferase family protein [Mycolicibacterium mageritense]TXI60791.1 MAG: N-acetyltransferase family protein [Mycolicibacterium mageritense]CDO20129.1 phosphinothricin N-acetyltransferase [Mycolicibacterium mageritense DSM 44476 = CIP 104973]BBX35362.1 N-acetyltransferase [Mycolicibacterium mageritense]BDY30260.1 Phosphinothricin N-acetyltransferase [Mycolicibacterium mageritense]
MSNAVVVRPTSADDLDAIGAIYAHHVQTGVATFELTPPDRAEWDRRLATARERELPFLTAVFDGEVAGYAYCAPWKARPAYDHTVENSIYLAPQATGRGIGAALLQALLAGCAAAGVREVIAVVVDTEDAAASFALHRRYGFAEAGRLRSVGFKHSRWLDTVLLQRSLEVS